MPNRLLSTLGTIVLPLVALAALAATWHRSIPVAVTALLGALLIGSVLAAVHHADVVAHRVGEPLGSIVLAVAVTVIEVSLIVTLMTTSDGGNASLARDTVFAAVIITCNGIAGLAILVGSIKHGTLRFNTEGAGAALIVVVTLTTLTLIVPDFTVSEPGPEFTPEQLGFVAVAAVLLYAAFVHTQTSRHRSFFLPVSEPPARGDGRGPGLPASDGASDDRSGQRPSTGATVLSLVMLLACLLAVVGIAEGLSPMIETTVVALGIPASFVGVVIAVIILLPEGIAATKAALRNEVQISLNLAYGSAMASIGLTIPTIAVAKIWLPGRLLLGLDPIQIALFALTVIVAAVSVIPGRATRLHGFVQLVILAAFLFLAIQP